MKLLLKIFGGLAILAVVAGGLGFFLLNRAAFTPHRPHDETVIRFTIEPGMGRNRLNEELARLDLIGSPALANLAVRFNDWTQVQAGEYELSPSQSLEDMYRLFAAGDVAAARHRIAIREGDRMLNIADDFAPVAGLADGETLLAIWDDPDFVRPFIEEFWFLTDEILDPELFHPFEGYFRPLTYEFRDESYTVEDITRTLLEFTEADLDPLRDEIAASGWTVHELLSFAAIVEGETPHLDEMADISGVFHNRLEAGWRLQSDVGAQYIADERQVRVTGDMVSVDSPFNTYMIFGLPVGPVNSPSLLALQTSLSPADNDYFFFAGDLFNCIDGRTHFNKEYADHDAFVERYLRPGYRAGYPVCP